MKALLFSMLLALSASFGGCISQAMQEHADTLNTAPAVGPAKPSVLVELFTSEGCSSCPPADKVLGFLGSEPVVPSVNIITLGYHVDYWDNNRWKDRFSSNVFTKRQEAYARGFKINSTYTPQMIVDGTRQFVGSDAGGAVDVIGRVLGAPKGTVTVSMNAGKLNIKVEDLPQHSDSAVYLAVAEDKLSSSVAGGENAGSKLEHSAVVRQLMLLGSVAAAQNSATFDQPLPTDANWKSENLKYVVFVQDGTTLKILAAGQAV